MTIGEVTLLQRYPEVFRQSPMRRFLPLLIALGTALYVLYAIWFFNLPLILSTAHWERVGIYLSQWISYDIQPQFQSTLNEVASTLATYNQTYIDIYGHTDSTGSDAYNQTLSERRAESVASYLASRGVVRARMATRGFGESQLLVNPETSEADRAANRRVEIKVVPLRQ